MSLKPVLLLSLSLAGCGIFAPSGPSEVGRGEYYSAGKPEFDSFFIHLHQLQVEVLSAPEEPRAARRTLTQAAGLGPEASDDSLKTRLAGELKKLAAQGLRVRLEVPEASTTPDASATLHTSSDAASSSIWRTSLPRDATRLVRVRNRMLAIDEELERLRVTGVQLDGSVDSAFRVDGPWKRSDVRRNLDDGQKVITLMSARAREVKVEAAKLLALLADATTTDASLGKGPVYSAPPDEDAAPAKPGKRAPGRAAPAKPGSEKPGLPKPAAAAAKPAPSLKSPAAKPRNEDDAPAPKPVQGNAPAEIEP